MSSGDGAAKMDAGQLEVWSRSRRLAAGCTGGGAYENYFAHKACGSSVARRRRRVENHRRSRRRILFLLICIARARWNATTNRSSIRDIRHPRSSVSSAVSASTTVKPRSWRKPRRSTCGTRRSGVIYVQNASDAICEAVKRDERGTAGRRDQHVPFTVPPTKECPTTSMVVPHRLFRESLSLVVERSVAFLTSLSPKRTNISPSHGTEFH